ncbi:acetyltransferase [Pseudomonadales bacterium]|nr:acetyltransferase [Pseudomonadales bacterium]
MVVILGAGGHAKVLLEILSSRNFAVHAVAAPTLESSSSLLLSKLKYYDNENDILMLPPQDVLLINGIGSLPGRVSRQSVFDKFASKGFRFMSVVSDRAIVSNSCQLGMGVQIMPGAIINADVQIGDNSIINTGAIIDHDCQLAENNHIAPGATLSGGVVCGKNVHVGTGANVIQGIRIGENSIVGAGATLTRDLNSSEKLYVARPFVDQRVSK